MYTCLNSHLLDSLNNIHMTVVPMCEAFLLFFTLKLVIGLQDSKKMTKREIGSLKLKAS